MPGVRDVKGLLSRYLSSEIPKWTRETQHQKMSAGGWRIHTAIYFLLHRKVKKKFEMRVASSTHKYCSDVRSAKMAGGSDVNGLLERDLSGELLHKTGEQQMTLLHRQV